VEVDEVRYVPDIQVLDGGDGVERGQGSSPPYMLPSAAGLAMRLDAGTGAPPAGRREEHRYDVARFASR